jgi:hypothetical protein
LAAGARAQKALPKNQQFPTYSCPFSRVLPRSFAIAFR